MTDAAIVSNVLTEDDERATYTTGQPLLMVGPSNSAVVLHPGWYRVDRTLTLTGQVTIEGGSITCVNAGYQREHKPEPEPKSSKAPPAVPPDSRPPRLVRLLSWLRRGPPSGEPVAGL